MLATWISNLTIVVKGISILLASVGLATTLKKIKRNFVYRHLRKVLGIRDGEKVLIVCSELPDPTKRQMVEDREYIYLMKYGDLDAWVELMFSLLRIYPNIDIQLVSSGEILTSRVDLEQHIFLIGGPDYNLLVGRIHEMGVNRIQYGLRTNQEGGEEITISDKVTGEEFHYNHLDKDYGYIEKIRNPFDSSKQVVFFGGCHTVGVTSATKFFSAFCDGKKEVSDKTLANAEAIAAKLKSTDDEFVILIDARKIGSSISAPSFTEAALVLNREREPQKLSIRKRSRPTE